MPEVEKEVIRPGSGPVPLYQLNTKAVFHFKTFQIKDDTTVGNIIDDTRTLSSGPFKLLIGREFKLKLWEKVIRMMKVGEVCKFTCPYEDVKEYPEVSKAVRELEKRASGEETHHHHQCGFSAMAHGLGYKDLDELVGTKCPLLFEFELLQVEQPGDYVQDSWAMTTQEKLDTIPSLREAGNSLYKGGKYEKAAEKYFEALEYLETLSMKEKPHSDSWNSFEEKKVPLLLNYAQCKLIMKDYAEVIRHTSTVLEFDPNNVKALYRRGKAHASCWNVKEAEADLQKACTLDPSLSNVTRRELSVMRQKIKENDSKEYQKLKGKLF